MSLNGTALPDFADFMLATKPHKISPTTEILNDAARKCYLLARMLKGRGNHEVVQSGQYIMDHVQLKKQNNGGFYRPNQNLQPKGVDTLSEVRTFWRFYQNNYGWTEEQVTLALAKAGAGGNAADVFTNLRTSWDQNCYTTSWDEMEEALWANPDAASMEAEGGEVPYSIKALVTNDGLAPAGFTTVCGQNPATLPNWRNQNETFDWSDRALNDAMYSAFDKMWRKLRWKRIPGFNAQAGSPATDWSKVIIVTNSEGVNGYLALNRAANDRLRKPNDAGYGDDATFNNIEIVDLEDDVVNFTAGAPEFFWLHLDYVFPVYHSEKYFQEVGPIRGSINQPFSHAIFKNTYYNLMLRSRKRLGKIWTTA